MYFVNKNNHVVASIDHSQIDVDSSIACYATEEELQIDYPTITDCMIPNIPQICPVENSNGDVEWFFNSNLRTHELVMLDMGQTIEDWMVDQDETFTTEDGVCF